jgi:hypothetical protein
MAFPSATLSRNLSWSFTNRRTICIVDRSEGCLWRRLPSGRSTSSLHRLPREQFLQTLKRTPSRPKAIYGIGQAAQATGDQVMAQQRYKEFLALWKNADSDRPEVATAKDFLAKVPAATHR